MMKLAPCTLCASLALACTCLAQAPATQPAAAPADPPARRAVSSEQALKQRLRQFKVEGMALSDVFRGISDASGANFHIRWNQLEQIGVDRQTPVSVDLRNVTLAKTLNVILDSVAPPDIQLGYYVHENVITVYISRSQQTNLVTRVYDITDLTFQIPDIEPGDYGGSGSNSSDSRSSSRRGDSSNSSSRSSRGRY